jgi:hypothetical protein
MIIAGPQSYLLYDNYAVSCTGMGWARQEYTRNGIRR